MFLEDKFALADFENETKILEEQLRREQVELNQFSLETLLIEKGVI